MCTDIGDKIGPKRPHLFFIPMKVFLFAYDSTRRAVCDHTAHGNGGKDPNLPGYFQIRSEDGDSTRPGEESHPAKCELETFGKFHDRGALPYRRSMYALAYRNFAVGQEGVFASR